MHSFIVQDIRISPVKADRLVGPMEVHELMIFCRRTCCTGVEVYHHLIVTVHEIYLPSLDSYSGIVLTYLFHIPVKCPVASPEHDTHVPLRAIFHQLFYINFRNDIEKVGFMFHCPTLIKDDIFDSVS